MRSTDEPAAITRIGTHMSSHGNSTDDKTSLLHYCDTVAGRNMETNKHAHHVHQHYLVILSNLSVFSQYTSMWLIFLCNKIFVCFFLIFFFVRHFTCLSYYKDSIQRKNNYYFMVLMFSKTLSDITLLKYICPPHKKWRRKKAEHWKTCKYFL